MAEEQIKKQEGGRQPELTPEQLDQVSGGVATTEQKNKLSANAEESSKRSSEQSHKKKP